MGGGGCENKFTHIILNLQECFKQFYSTKEGAKIPEQTLSNNLNIDLLMETGTGKTFTYLNLIFALNKRFHQNKFIIFVPRRAILESLKQNIKQTRNYFYKEFKKELCIYSYESQKGISNIINGYIKNDDELSVLILTNSSMDKEANILNKQKETLFNDKSIFENIAALKPICILDEPHLLKGEAFNKYFSKIQSLYFRFGATFPKDKENKLSNLIFALDSVRAFNEYLVKQIRVDSISADYNFPFLLATNKNIATIGFYNGNVKMTKAFKKGDDLSVLGLNGVSINKISKDKLYLSDNSVVERQSNYHLSKNDISNLIEKAIDLHFEKEERLFKENIKALSLFFIPNTWDFRQIQGKGEPFIKKEFERLYKQKREQILQKTDLDPKYRTFLQKDFDESLNLRVHQGYFSGDSTQKSTNKEEALANDIKLILEDKEKLLSFASPLRFIFSVWALQEGWDNPNIFTITKLAHSSSDISRHQQVGRGLRLCVNQDGKRITHSFCGFNDDKFFTINYLDMLTSGSEFDFIESLQKEIEDSSFHFTGEILQRVSLENLGLNQRQINNLLSDLEDKKVIEFDEANDNYKIIAPIFECVKNNEKFKNLLADKFDSVLSYFTPSLNKNPQIIDKSQDKKKIKIRSNLALEFKDLWLNINKRAKIVYKNIDNFKLIQEITQIFNAHKIPTKDIIFESKVYDVKNNRIKTLESKSFKRQDFKANLESKMPILLKDFAKDLNLPLFFVLEIYNKLEKQNFYNDLDSSLQTLKNIIKESLHKNLLTSVNYNFTKQCFSNSNPKFDLLFDEHLKPKEYIEAHNLGHYHSQKKVAQNYLYEKGVYDSFLEEEVITHNQEQVENLHIKVFAKLPKFSIPTPYKEYQPDFAYLLQDNFGDKIFFICETKGYEFEEQIPQDERKKIDYARAFFKDLQSFLNAKSAKIKVKFETRMSRENLLQTLQKITKD